MARACAWTALLACAACTSPPAKAPETQAPPNILLVTIDTLRADRLGRGFTPTLDRLASEGLDFTHTRAAVPLTLPSHATILSGLLPPHHGVRENATYRFDATRPTIASLLKARGYRTGAVVGAFVLDRQFGLDTGFDSYDDRIPRSPDASVRLESERKAAAVTDAALAWLDAVGSPARRPAPQEEAARGAESPARRPAPQEEAARGAESPARRPAPQEEAARGAGLRAGDPFFLWVHYYDPHAPYEPPRQYADAAKGQLYDGEIAYVDAEIRRLLDGLAARRQLAATAVVVVGDHGESLGEHGERTHGMLLYESAVRVPLIVKAPGIKPAVRTDPASLADIAPTVLGLVRQAGRLRPAGVGALSNAAMDGVDLLAGLQPADRELYAETNYPRVAGWAPQRSLVSRSWKLLRSSPLELYDIDRDPGETTNLSPDRAGIASAMARRVAELDVAGEGQATAPGPDVQERLRALGYVAATPSAQAASTAPSPAREIAAWGEFEDALTDVASGRRDRALPRLARLAAKYPGAQVFHRTYAQTLLDSGRAADALRAFRGLAARWPTDASLLHDLAVAARVAGDPAEALRAEQAALLLDPRYPAALDGVGLLHADAGRPREAAAAFEKAAALEPSNPSYWTNVGNAARELGDGARATDAYQRALAIDASWPDAANGIGVVLVQGRRPADAIPWFEKALARSPDLVEAQLNLGIALQEDGQIDRARAQYRKVLSAPKQYRQQRDAAAKLLGALR
jgi:choline-sulfatase